MGKACNTVGEMRNASKILDGKRERRDHLKDLDADGRIILEWMLGKQVWRCELDAFRSVQRPVTGYRKTQ